VTLGKGRMVKIDGAPVRSAATLRLFGSRPKNVLLTKLTYQTYQEFNLIYYFFFFFFEYHNVQSILSSFRWFVTTIQVHRVKKSTPYSKIGKWEHLNIIIMVTKHNQ